MTVAALVLGVLGLAVAAISLGWQIVTYRLNSPRISVVGTWGLVSVPSREFSVLIITVTNGGREAATVTRFGLLLPDGGLVICPSFEALNDPLPYRLDGNSEVNFYIELTAAIPACESAATEPSELRPFVALPGNARKLGKPFGEIKIQTLLASGSDPFHERGRAEGPTPDPSGVEDE